jgi:hypothetical protein
MPAERDDKRFTKAIEYFAQGLALLVQAGMPESNTETRGYVKRAGALKFLDISDSKFRGLIEEKKIPEGKEIGGTLHWKWAWLEKYTEDPQRNINNVKRVPPKKR